MAGVSNTPLPGLQSSSDDRQHPLASFPGIWLLAWPASRVAYPQLPSALPAHPLAASAAALLAPLLPQRTAAGHLQQQGKRWHPSG